MPHQAWGIGLAMIAVGGTTGAPMTYLTSGKQYIVVAVGWTDTPGELVALALP
jgi:hypothetical protein